MQCCEVTRHHHSDICTSLNTLKDEKTMKIGIKIPEILKIMELEMTVYILTTSPYTNHSNNKKFGNIDSMYMKNSHFNEVLDSQVTASHCSHENCRDTLYT